jgi:RES domain-containing protein
MRRADLVGAIDALPEGRWAGQAFRHVGGGRAPLSGEGARITGGRWNPRGSFPVLYLGVSQDVVVAEFRRLAEKQGVPLASFLPRTLYTYEIEVRRLLDLRPEGARSAVGLTDGDLVSDDLRRCQEIGEAAHDCGREGILVPGATGAGDVLAIFIARLQPATVVADVAAELWETVP